jgi:hypothetical protein
VVGFELSERSKYVLVAVRVSWDGSMDSVDGMDRDRCGMGWAGMDGMAWIWSEVWASMGGIVMTLMIEM